MPEFNIRFEKDLAKKVAYLTFCRPEKLNAILRKDWDEMTRLIQAVNEDEDVKVLVFRGEGRAFGSGHDVAELGVQHEQSTGRPGEPVRRPSQRKRLAVDRGSYWGRPGTLQTILYCQKATVAQVHGICWGGHMEIMNCCDMAVASEDATFTHPGFRYIGPLGEIGLLIETIGLKRVKQMMLTGVPFTAQEALDCGLVNRVVTRDKLEEETEKLVEAVCRLPFDGIVMGKANFEAALDALGVGSSFNSSYIIHAMQTGIRYEEGEFNLLKARRDVGVKGAIMGREQHYGEVIPS